METVIDSSQNITMVDQNLSKRRMRWCFTRKPRRSQLRRMVSNDELVAFLRSNYRKRKRNIQIRDSRNRSWGSITRQWNSGISLRNRMQVLHCRASRRGKFDKKMSKKPSALLLPTIWTNIANSNMKASHEEMNTLSAVKSVACYSTGALCGRMSPAIVRHYSRCNRFLFLVSYSRTPALITNHIVLLTERADIGWCAWCPVRHSFYVAKRTGKTFSSEALLNSLFIIVAPNYISASHNCSMIDTRIHSDRNFIGFDDQVTYCFLLFVTGRQEKYVR